MLRKETHFTLKDGRTALIRCPKEEDIQGMLDYLYISSKETAVPELCMKKWVSES